MNRPLRGVRLRTASEARSLVVKYVHSKRLFAWRNITFFSPHHRNTYRPTGRIIPAGWRASPWAPENGTPLLLGAPVVHLKKEFRQELANMTAFIADPQNKLSAVTSELNRGYVAVGGLVPGVGGPASNPLTAGGHSGTVGGHGGSHADRDAQTSSAQHWRKRQNQIYWCLSYVARGEWISAPVLPTFRASWWTMSWSPSASWRPCGPLDRLIFATSLLSSRVEINSIHPGLFRPCRSCDYSPPPLRLVRRHSFGGRPGCAAAATNRHGNAAHADFLTSNNLQENQDVLGKPEMRAFIADIPNEVDQVVLSVIPNACRARFVRSTSSSPGSGIQ